MIIEKATVSDAGELLVLQKLGYRSEAEILIMILISLRWFRLWKAWRKILEIIFFLRPFSMENHRVCQGKCRGRNCYIGRLVVHPDFQIEELDKTDG